MFFPVFVFSVLAYLDTNASVVQRLFSMIFMIFKDFLFFVFFWFLELSYDHIYENTTPQQRLTVVSAEDLETKYGAVVQECGDVSWYHLKSALYAKIPPIDVSPGVIAPAFQ